MAGLFGETRTVNQQQLMKTYIPSRLLSLVAGGLALTSAPFSGSAQTLFNVDAGTGSSPTYSGAAVLGSSGDLWNAYGDRHGGPTM